MGTRGAWPAVAASGDRPGVIMAAAGALAGRDILLVLAPLGDDGQVSFRRAS